MNIINNTLYRIDEDDIIDGVFVAPDDVLYIGNYFNCNYVIKMILPNVIEIGDDFLYTNMNLSYLEMPKVEKIGDEFLYTNDSLVILDIPNVKEIGRWFLSRNTKFRYTPRIIKALKGNLLIGHRVVDKKEYLRKYNLKKLLC